MLRKQSRHYAKSYVHVVVPTQSYRHLVAIMQSYRHLVVTMQIYRHLLVPMQSYRHLVVAIQRKDGAPARSVITRQKSVGKNQKRTGLEEWTEKKDNKRNYIRQCCKKQKFVFW